MKNGAKIAIVVILALAVAATFALRGGKRAGYVVTPEKPAVVSPPVQVAAVPAEPVPAKPASAPAPRVVAASAKPRLLEIGSSRCMSCIEMAKVLDALRTSQGAKLQVDFVDVFEQPEAGDRYKISLIPTQILYDTAGKEIFRHTGYFSHDDILAKFRELGVKI
ncbi:MAG: thioredoxin family protein [Candidatus Methylomirabilia bacterium]